MNLLEAFKEKQGSLAEAAAILKMLGHTFPKAVAQKVSAVEAGISTADAWITGKIHEALAKYTTEQAESAYKAAKAPVADTEQPEDTAQPENVTPETTPESDHVQPEQTAQPENVTPETTPESDPVQPEDTAQPENVTPETTPENDPVQPELYAPDLHVVEKPENATAKKK